MNRRIASSALSALFFAQGLLGIAALASTVLDRTSAAPIVMAQQAPDSLLR